MIEEIKTPSEIITGFWHEILTCDFYIFVPKAGLKYAFGFVEDRQETENVIFWEYHTGIEKGKELIVFNKNLKNKKVAIIDRLYSGKTLQYFKKAVKKLKGIPIRVALYPKSRDNLDKGDWILFLDKFLKVKNIPSGKKWAEELFIKVINN